jgi:hypothetical protein
LLLEILRDFEVGIIRKVVSYVSNYHHANFGEFLTLGRTPI